MRLVPAIAIALLASACSSDQQPVHVLRLADALAEAGGRPVGSEAVAGVTRITFPASYIELLKTPVRPPGEAADVPVTCPARLVGRPAVIAVGTPQQMSVHRFAFTRRIQCPPAAGVPLAVPVASDVPLEQTLWIIRGREADRADTGPVTIASGARLRVALGVVQAMPDVPAPPVTFRVVATSGDTRVVVFERRLAPLPGAMEAGWELAEADLDGAGRALRGPVHLAFEASFDDAIGLTVPVWGDPTIVWPAHERAAPPTRRNVLLVSLDTLRADRLGMYGERRPTSPKLDAYAAESTLFDEAIAPAPWTLPSHASMMTGLYPCALGLTNGLGNQLPRAVAPLAERLRGAGYTTAAFTEDAFLDSATFSRGFGYYQETRAGPDRVRTTVARAERWLREESIEPFFVFLHTYQVHDPYFAPGGYAERLGPPAADASDRPPAARADLDKYDAAIRYTDDAIASLLDAVRARGRGARTLVVVTSDHGEAFGEHGYTGHGRTLHEELLHVPLFVWAPGLAAAGRRVPGLVGLIDVTPTILDLLGLPAPEGAAGTSLAPQVRAGAAPPPLGERLLFAENTLNDVHRVAVRAPHWKAMWDGTEFHAFDLDADPGERRAAAAPAIASEGAAARARFADECRRRSTALAAAAQAPATPRLPDPDRERELKALGYVE